MLVGRVEEYRAPADGAAVRKTFEQAGSMATVKLNASCFCRRGD